MTPKEIFDVTIQRVERLLNLYQILSNQRRRSCRETWKVKFKKLMNWPKDEKINRIDGKNAILILREQSSMNQKEFCHEELSEILRAAFVTSISALDRFCHDLVVDNLIIYVNKPYEKWLPKLREQSIPLIDVKKIIEHTKKRRGEDGKKRPRPLNLLKSVIQEQLFRQTMQSPSEIEQAMGIIGKTALWTKCESQMNEKPEKIKSRLNSLVKRRNRIVHEGDIKRFRRGAKPVLNQIKYEDTKKDVEWLKKLVDSINNCGD